MRIISWNCAGGFRRKFSLVDKLDFDVCVIQECEDPYTTPSVEYKNWAGSCLWLGNNRNKGIGIFLRNGFTAEKLEIPDHGNELFLPFRLNHEINILGIWTKNADKVADSYIGQLYNYLTINKAQICNSKSILLGDLNSNSIWDTMRPGGNHADVVNMLEVEGIRSVYHQQTAESHGEESQSTFFMHRHLDKGFHIDYCFASSSILEKLEKFELGDEKQWLSDSDHLPMIMDFGII